VNIVEGASSDAWGFDPSTVQVGVGDTVDWRNTGTMEHSVTADDGSFDSGLVAVSGTYTHTFATVGTFSYHCTPHPWMKGTVVVSKTAPTSGKAAVRPGPVPASGGGTAPPSGGGGGVAKPVAVAPVAIPVTDPRVFALLLVGALTLACATLLVGRWWGQITQTTSGVSR